MEEYLNVENLSQSEIVELYNDTIEVDKCLNAVTAYVQCGNGRSFTVNPTEACYRYCYNKCYLAPRFSDTSTMPLTCSHCY